jgi:hypothetical protein
VVSWLVMPLNLMSGDAWEASRTLLKKDYDDLVLVSIAGAEDAELSFSADTGMGVEARGAVHAGTVFSAMRKIQ